MTLPPYSICKLACVIGVIVTSPSCTEVCAGVSAWRPGGACAAEFWLRVCAAPHAASANRVDVHRRRVTVITARPRAVRIHSVASPPPVLIKSPHLSCSPAQILFGHARILPSLIRFQLRGRGLHSSTRALKAPIHRAGGSSRHPFSFFMIFG